VWTESGDIGPGRRGGRNLRPAQRAGTQPPQLGGDLLEDTPANLMSDWRKIRALPNFPPAFSARRGTPIQLGR
jgi:hypothetical protein